MAIDTLINHVVIEAIGLGLKFNYLGACGTHHQSTAKNQNLSIFPALYR